MQQLMYILCSIYVLLSPIQSATCISKSASQLEWISTNNKIYLNGEEFKLKGLSWFGFESDTMIVHGLATYQGGGNSYINLLNWIKEKGFNAIRLPFSQYMINSENIMNEWQIDALGNNIFANKTPLECMDIIIDSAAERGILIMLDFHSRTANGYKQGMNDIGLNSAKSTWIQLAKRYKNKWNIFMADMYNEAYDVGNNGDNSEQYTWNSYINWIQDMSNALIDQNVNWLFGVQGTNNNCNLRKYSDKYCYWGENLQGVSPFNGNGKTVELSLPNRFVWLPHVYGPDISSTVGYGALIWQDHWGFLCDNTNDNNNAACIIGEFGTKLESTTWLSTLIEYLISINQRNTYYWCLNPDSSHSGGLLKDDWKTDQTQKLNYLNKLQPNPTIINIKSTQICLDSNHNSITTSTTTTTTLSSGSMDGEIKITNEKGANQWWYAVVLSNIPSGVYIRSVKLQANGMNSWELGSLATWDSNGLTYIFNGNKPYLAPFSFRIISNKGIEITSLNIIKSLKAGNEPDFGYMDSSSSFIQNNNSNIIHWTAIFAIVFVILCFICAVIGGIYYFKRKKQVIIVSSNIDDMETPVDDGQNKIKTGYDMSPLTNNKKNNNKHDHDDDDDDEEELEMEIEMETNP